MALLSVIRRWHFRERMPIREIERRIGLSRNTIRKYLRNGTAEPKFQVPDRPSKLDPYAEKLSGWLRIEAGKSRKQRRTVTPAERRRAGLGLRLRRRSGCCGVRSRRALWRRQSRGARQAAVGWRGTLKP